MDDLRYEAYQREKFRRFEGACRRCGECCGSRDGDPCLNLARDEAAGKYYCRVYGDRLGPQKTVSGIPFNCVPISDIIRTACLRPNCAYNTITDKTGAAEPAALK